MRCLILFAVCLALARASYWNRNRFQRLLNRYQNQNRYNIDENTHGDLYGSDDVDDYIDDYVDQIRRDRMFERDQCPRDIDGTFGLDDCDTGDFDSDELFEGFQGRDMRDIRGSWYEDETTPSFELLKEVEDANTKLASRLYKESKDERDDKNILVSPISIQLALAALNLGTRGTTKRQIGRVIGGRLQKHERRQIYRTIIRKLRGYGQTGFSTVGHKSQIKPVTGIFVSQSTPAQQMFVQVIKNNLGATVKHCNFHRQPQQCRQMINHWLAQRTHGKLTQVVPQDAITDNTKLIVVNSMHVKATWGPQMRRHTTKEAKFYPLDTKKVKIVEVMETEGRFKYHEDELVKIVGLPTQQKELTLYVTVPKEKDGLTEVEKLHLHDGVQLRQLLEVTDRRTHRVGVHLPKFQIKHKIDVRRTLRKQGVTDAFDPLRADFSGITGVSKYQQDEMDDVYNRLDRNTLLDEESLGNWRSGMETMRTPWQTGITDSKLHLNKFIHQCTIKITENGITATTGAGNDLEDFEQYGHSRFGRLGGLEDIEQYGRYGLEDIEEYGRLGRGASGSWDDWQNDDWNVFEKYTRFGRDETSGEKVVKANHAFAFVLKHNPTNQLVFVGRVIDAAQKKVNNVHQTINVVDQF